MFGWLQEISAVPPGPIMASCRTKHSIQLYISDLHYKIKGLTQYGLCHGRLRIVLMRCRCKTFNFFFILSHNGSSVFSFPHMTSNCIWFADVKITSATKLQRIINYIMYQGLNHLNGANDNFCDIAFKQRKTKIGPHPLSKHLVTFWQTLCRRGCPTNSVVIKSVSHTFPKKS